MTAADPAILLRDAIAAERGRSGSVKAAIAAVARLAGITPRRAAAIWYGEAVRLDWAEAERVRAAAARQLRHDMAEAEARAARLRARLTSAGEMHAPSADHPVAPGILARAALQGRG